MSYLRSITVAASLMLALACNNNDAPDGERHGGGGANGLGDNHQPTPAERTGSTIGAAAAMSAEDQQFVQKAAMSGQMEVALGNMAEDKAADDSVKQLGERIADDHESANRDLQSQLRGSNNDATRTGGNDSSTGQAQTMPEHQEVRQRLESLSGAAFDRAYLEEMVKHHQQDIAEFERAAQSSNQQIRDFAQRTLPTLRQHLQAAQQLQQTNR